MRERIGALGITEPGGGSDVAGLRTTARRDGDAYVVNSAKAYITSGVRADFVTTAVRTGGEGYGGITLLVIDKDVKALTRVADVHYVLEKGRVVWRGSSAELSANQDVQHRYLGV